VVRLVQIRFPSLLDNVLDLCTPMEVAATLAKDEAVRKTGLKREEIGTFFISPCGAKVTSVRKPIGTDKTDVDGVLSLASVYSAIADKVKKVQPMPLSKASMIGIGWAKSGGEAALIPPFPSASVSYSYTTQNTQPCQISLATSPFLVYFHQ